MRFAEIRHQQSALSLLTRMLRGGRTHHAFLFDGPDGVGKELTARALAAQLLCLHANRPPDAEPCGTCSSCHQLAAGNHPDLHMIDRSMHKFSRESTIRKAKGLYLVVDVIREFLIEPSSVSPSQGRRRIFIVREAERMNEDAQNCLLKTLEEPPGSAVIILVTSSPMRLLPTIRSRCARIPFGVLPREFIESQLSARLKLAPEIVRTLATLADGRLGVALQGHTAGWLTALDRVAALIETDAAADLSRFGSELIDIAAGLIRKPEKEAAIEEPDDEDEDDGESEPAAKTTSRGFETEALRSALKQTLALLAAIYRDILLVNAGADGLTGLPTLKRLVAAQVARHTPDSISAAIQAIASTESMLDRNVAPELVLDRLATLLPTSQSAAV